MRRFSLIITTPTGSRIVRLLPEGEVTLGRNPICDIVLSEEQISRQHAKLIVQDGNISLQDLGSNNGTFIEGERISSVKLTGNEVVTIGSFKLSITEGTETPEGKRKNSTTANTSNRTPVPSSIARQTKPPITPGSSGSVPAVSANSAQKPTLSEEDAKKDTQKTPVPLPRNHENVKKEQNPWESQDGQTDVATTTPLAPDFEEESPFEEDQTVRLRASHVNTQNTGVRRLEQLEVLELNSLTRQKGSPEERIAEDGRRVELISKVSDALLTQGQYAAKELIDALVLILQADTAVLLTGDSPSSLEEMTPQALHHREPLDAGEVPVSRTVVKEVLEQKKPIVAGDVRGDERFEVGASLFLYNVASVIAAPLLFQNQLLGVLYVNRWNGGSFEERDLAFVVSLANLAALILYTNSSTPQPDTAPQNSFVPEAHQRLSLQVGEKKAKRFLTTFQKPEHGMFQSAKGTALIASLSEIEPFLVRLGAKRVGELLCTWQELFSNAVLEKGGLLISVDGFVAKAFFVAQETPGKEVASTISCALSCRKLLQEWLLEKLPRMRIKPSFGIHSSSCFFGLWGPKDTLGLTAVGEALEGAADLESAAAPGEILASSSSLAPVEGRFELGPIDPSRLAGVPEDLARAFAVFGPLSR